MVRPEYIRWCRLTPEEARQERAKGRGQSNALQPLLWLLGFHMHYHVSKTRADSEFKGFVCCDQGIFYYVKQSHTRMIPLYDK